MKGWPGEPDMDYDVLVADGAAAANAGKPITDVIFDFGNVLIYWDPVAVLIPRYSQKTIDEFLDNDISGFYDVNDLMDGGTSTDEAIASCAVTGAISGRTSSTTTSRTSATP